MKDKEKELINKFNSTPFDVFKEEEDEETLFDTAKAMRKKEDLPAPAFNPDDALSYGELIKTKPKEDAPASSVKNLLSSYNNRFEGVDTKNLIRAPGTLNEETSKYVENREGVLPGQNYATINTLKDASKPLGTGLGAVASAFDKVDDVLVKKGVAGATSVGTALYYQGKELVDSIKEDRDFDWLSAGEKWEEKNQRLEYAFGTNLNTSDYLDFRTSNEKRKDILKDLPISKQEELKELDNVGLLADISAGILSGVGISSALGKLSALGKTATVARASGKTLSFGAKMAPSVGKVASVLEKTINPSLSNMAKVGAVTAGMAIPYYGLTGEWIFDGNERATEGAGIMLGGLGFKLGGEALTGFKGAKNFISKTKEGFKKEATMDDLFNNEEFKKGAEDFFKNAKEDLVTKTPKYNETSIDDKKEILSQLKNTMALKDEAGSTIKSDTIQSLVDKGILKENKVYKNKQGKEIIRFTYTNEGRKFLPKKLQNDILSGKRRASDIGIRTDADMWKNRTKPVQEIPTKEKIDIKGLKDELNRIEAVKNSQKKSIKQNIINEGMWDDKKNSFSNYYDYFYNKSTSKFIKNEDRVMGELLGDKGVKNFVKKADRTVQKQLEGTNIFGKVERIKKQVKEVQDVVGNDYADFNQYLWAKSRLNKTINQEAKGKTLKTTRTSPLDGSRKDITKEELKAIVDEGEIKFNSLGKRVQEINKEVLEFEVKAGVRTQKEMDNFIKTNPDYIPDNLSAEDLDKMIKTGNFKPDIVKLGKGLKEGSENSDYSINAIDNLYKSMAYRMNVASRVDKINTALKYGEDSGIIRVWDGKEGLRQGEAGIRTIIDGQSKIVIMPKFYKEAIERNEALSEFGTFRTLASMPTRITKEWATGRLNPMFQVMSPAWEIPNALMKNASNGGKTKDFIKALAGNGIYNTPAGKRAMLGLLEDLGGDFGYIKYLKEEFDATSIGKADSEFLKANTKVKKVGDILGKGVNFGHQIEKYTTRLPLFEAQLKKQGLTTKIFEEAVNQANGSGVKLQEILEAKGFDLKGGGNVVRSLFDYTVASKTIREISRFLPYLNTSVSATTSMKRLYEESPAKFMTYMIGAYLMVDTMASYNYGTKSVLGLGSEDKEKNQMMKNQSDYVKHKVGLVNSDGESVGIMELGRNIPMMEWLYPLVAESKINGGDIDMKTAFNKVVKDFTYIGDLNQENGIPIDFNKIPSGFKQMLEVGLNKDIFYGGDLVKDWEAMSENKTEEYNKYTDEVFIKASRWLALASGGELLDNGTIEGGTQLSPIAMQKLFSIVDTKGIVGRELSELVTDAETGKGEPIKLTKRLRSLIEKQYSIKASDDELFNLKEGSDEDRIFNNNISVAFDKVENEEQLADVVRNSIEKYSAYPDFKEKKEKIVKEIEKKQAIFKYGEQSYYEAESTSEQLGKYYYQIYVNKGPKALAKKMKTLLEMNKDGYYSDYKLEKMSSTLSELITKKD